MTADLLAFPSSDKEGDWNGRFTWPEVPESEPGADENVEGEHGGHKEEAAEASGESEEGERGKPICKHKKKIAFQIKSSTKRRNVDKYIVKRVVRYHLDLKDEILTEYRRSGFTENDFWVCAEKLRSVREASQPENTHEYGRRQDYAMLLNVLLGDLRYLLILKVCLQHSLRYLTDIQLRRIIQRNIPVYLATVQDYLAYVNATISK
jgi:hypothetical protein